MIIVAGSRRVEVTEEHQLYSSSTVYFRQEAGVHLSRRAISLGPTSSRTTTEEDDTSSSDSDIDHESNENPHVRRRGTTRDPLGGRRGTSVDLHNFHRDVVSHHATTHITSPASIPTIENTPEESPSASAANLSASQLPPPPDHGSLPQPHSLPHVRPNSFPVQRDQRPPISGTGDDVIPGPLASRSQRRASQALEDFRRALRSDPNPISALPPQTDTSPTLNRPLHTPLNETPSRLSPSRSPDRFDDDAHGRRSKSRSRFSLSAISDAILDSMRSHSPLAAKRRTEGTSMKFDAHDSEKNGETMRGRSREKSKGKSRDLSHALIKVSEVFGLEPEEGSEYRDGWKEFKKGALLPKIVPKHIGPHGSAVLQELTHIRYRSPFQLTPHHLWSVCTVRSPGA